MLRPKLILAAMTALALSGWCVRSASAEVIAYWQFEDGAFLNDSSGNGHTLANTNVTQDTQVPSGGGKHSASFNGTNAFLKTASTLDLTGYSQITISWWQRVNTTGIGVVFEHSTNMNGAANAFITSVNENAAGNAVLGTLFRGLGTGYNSDQLPHKTDGSWEQLSMTIDLTKTGGDAVTSLNITTNTPGSTIAASNPSTPFRDDTLFIGARAGAQFFLNGNIDNLKIEGTLAPEPAPSSVETRRPSETSTAFPEKTSANRLTYLDTVEPYYASHRFPKLTTPMWVGTEGVESVIAMEMWDLTDSDSGPNSSAFFEAFLRPILTRLQEISGRSPVSIFAISVKPDDPVLQKWLGEGISLDAHTINHVCPTCMQGDLQTITQDMYRCFDLLAKVPNCRPSAMSLPCGDVYNSGTPRFYTEVYLPASPDGRFITSSVSINNIYSGSDPELPREITHDEAGRERFRKFINHDRDVFNPTEPNYVFTNYVENYPYPFVIGRIWEIPFCVPGDHNAAFHEAKYGHRTIEEWKKLIDAGALKQGITGLGFHPWGKISTDEVFQIINYPVEKYGKRVEFVTVRDIHDRIDRNLLLGNPLRAKDGSDNGVRLLDLNSDGYLDVVIGNETLQRTRLWQQEKKAWSDGDFPTKLAGPIADGTRHETGVRFGILDADGLPTAIVRNDQSAGAWKFDGQKWIESKERLEGLEIDGKPIFTSRDGKDQGVRLRDIDGDGRCELIVGNPTQNAVFGWSADAKRWNRLPYSLPAGTTIVDEQGRDAGLRFADVNGDGRDDVLFSNDTHYCVNAFASPVAGWATEVVRGEDKPDRAIPPFVLNGGNNGVFFNLGRLWVLNEKTKDLPSHAFTVELSKLHELGKQ